VEASGEVREKGGERSGKSRGMGKKDFR